MKLIVMCTSIFEENKNKKGEKSGKYIQLHRA